MIWTNFQNLVFLILIYVNTLNSNLQIKLLINIVLNNKNKFSKSSNTIKKVKYFCYIIQ